MPKPAEQTSFSLGLNEISAAGVASVVEMHQAAGISERHMRNVVSICDSTQLSLQAAIRLSHWLVTERNETRHLTTRGPSGRKPCLLGQNGLAVLEPEDFENDDCLHDEMAEAQKLLGRADDLLKEGKREEAKKVARQARAKVDEAIADIDTPA